MLKEDIKSWPTYKNLESIRVEDNGDKLVVLSDFLLFGYAESRSELREKLNGKVYVRESVNQKLINAQNELANINKNYCLYLLEGYRPIEIQTKRFMSMLSKLSLEKYYDNSVDLYDAVHERVAVPSVAGHPTGGAVDILIFDKANSKFLDFGSEIYNYEGNKFNFDSEGLSEDQKKNRYLLRGIMKNSGFAPYNGEYWHFSYGDKEWAYIYKKQNAIYDFARGL